MTAVALWFGHALAQAPAGAPSETAQGMVGAWEISNAARDKTCAVSFSVDAGEGGFKLDLDPTCRTVFPSLRDVGAWAIGPKDSVHLLDAKGAVVLDFAEVESRMYEAERKGEGLFFMRTQAAIRAATITPDQLFGDWTLLQEFEKPLCKLTLSNTSADRGQRAGVRRPLGRLAIFRKRCNHLGAHPAQHRSAADDAPVSPLRGHGPLSRINLVRIFAEPRLAGLPQNCTRHGLAPAKMLCRCCRKHSRADQRTLICPLGSTETA
jgi:hypothetical protein